MSATRDPIDSMAPWDAVPYFEEPKETSVSLSGITQVCAPNPNRVALMFAIDPSVATTLSTSPAVAAGKGISLSTNTPPVLLRFADVGPLVQQAWFAVANAGFGGVVTVWEVVLAKWPSVKIPGKGAQRADAANARKRDRNGR